MAEPPVDGNPMAFGGNVDSKTKMKLLTEMISVGQKLKNNDTAGAQEGLLSLTTTIVKANNPNITEEEMTQISNALKEKIANMTASGGFTLGDSGSGSNVGGGLGGLLNLGGLAGNSSGGQSNMGSLFGGYTHNPSVGNETEYSNGTEVSHHYGNWTDLRSGLSHSDLLEAAESRQHGATFVMLSRLVLIAFLYYIPRTIYTRITRIGIEKKQATFFLILYLSILACAGGLVHILFFHHDVTNNPIVTIFTGIGSGQYSSAFSSFLFRALATSFNRTISPIIGILCLQQLAAFGVIKAPFLHNRVVQAILCLLITAAVFCYTFYVGSQVLESVDESLGPVEYPDPYDANMFLDQAIPIVTGIIYFYARQKVSRSTIYTTEKAGPDGPCTLDRVSRCVLYQAIMAVIGIAVFFFRDNEEHDVSSFMTFLVAGQSPFVYWTLFRSLNRSRKPTRLCFLLCCTSEQKVSAGEGQGIEMNAHPQTNEPSQKNEDEDEEEESTQETLDPNKIILMRESQVEREEEDKRKNEDGNQQTEAK